jgi:hypothetical protein
VKETCGHNTVIWSPNLRGRGSENHYTIRIIICKVSTNPVKKIYGTHMGPNREYGNFPNGFSHMGPIWDLSGKMGFLTHVFNIDMRFERSFYNFTDKANLQKVKC